jgi:hypothetical protein
MSVLTRSPFRYTSESESGPFPGILPDSVRVPVTLEDPSAAGEAASDLLRELLAQRVALTLPAGMLD